MRCSAISSQFGGDASVSHPATARRGEAFDDEPGHDATAGRHDRPRLHPRALRSLLHDAACGPRRADHQGRAPRSRRRHARVGTAVRERRKRLLPEHQSQQGEPDARPQASRGGRNHRRAAAPGRRARRKLPARHDGSARARIRPCLREAPAARVLLHLGIRGLGAADKQKRATTPCSRPKAG